MPPYDLRITFRKGPKTPCGPGAASIRYDINFRIFPLTCPIPLHKSKPGERDFFEAGAGFMSNISIIVRIKAGIAL